MSVLEAFMHDPLLEWSKKTKLSGYNVVNQFAVTSLNTVDKKLQGLMSSGFPLSVEGQVQDLISEAVDMQNLSKMYIGWAAYY